MGEKEMSVWSRSVNTDKWLLSIYYYLIKHNELTGILSRFFCFLAALRKKSIKDLLEIVCRKICIVLGHCELWAITQHILVETKDNILPHKPPHHPHKNQSWHQKQLAWKLKIPQWSHSSHWYLPLTLPLESFEAYSVETYLESLKLDNKEVCTETDNCHGEQKDYDEE